MQVAAAQMTEQITPKPVRRRNNRVTEEKKQKIKTLAENNPTLTHQQIATLEDSKRSTVTKILLDYGIEKHKLDDYKGNRADILAGLQTRIIDSITNEDIKKAPVGSRILAVAQLIDKERLERGQSTENVSLLVGAIQDLQSRRSGKSD
jgi:hypothetical protein